jgi:hypothetical protein
VDFAFIYRVEVSWIRIYVLLKLPRESPLFIRRIN